MRHYEVKEIEDLPEWLGMDWDDFFKEYNSFVSMVEIINDEDEVCAFIADGDDGFAIASHGSELYDGNGFTFRVISGEVELSYDGMRWIIEELEQAGAAKAAEIEAEELEWAKHHEKAREIYNNAHD